MPDSRLPTARPVASDRWRVLLLAVVCTLLSHTGFAADELRIGSDSAALGTLGRLREAYLRHEIDTVTLFTTIGAGSGVTALLSGALDVAVVTAELTDDERPKVAAFEIARTPFVFAVGRNSKVGEISLDQLLEIYQGRTVRWPDGSRIRLVLRPASVPDTRVLKRLSPEWKKALDDLESRRGMVVVPTAQEAAERVERTPGALATLTASLIVTEKRAVKMLRIDGVTPSAKALADGAYRHYEPVIIATLPKPSAAAERFVAFVRSAAGRAVLLGSEHALLQTHDLR